MEALRISALLPGGRFRAGRFWPAEGVVVALEELDERAQTSIAADPYLRVEPAEPAAEAAAEADASARAEILAAIAELPPDAFGADGKPRLDAVRAARPTLKISAALRDEVWAEAKVAAAG